MWTKVHYECFPKIQISVKKLKTLALRILNIPNACECAELGDKLFFTLCDNEGDVFFQSQEVYFTLNPTWHDMDLSFCERRNCAIRKIKRLMHTVLVKVYKVRYEGGDETETSLLLTYKIEMDSLKRIDSDLDAVPDDMPVNSLLFVFPSGCYVAPIEDSFKFKELHLALGNLNSPRNSYTIEELKKYLQRNAHLEDLKLNHNLLKRKLNAALQFTGNKSLHLEKLSQAVLKLSRTKEAVTRKRQLLNKLSMEQARLTAQREKKNLLRNTTVAMIEKHSLSMEKKKCILEELKIKKQEIEEQLTSRQRQLVYELATIFIIGKGSSNDGVYRIVGIALPNSLKLNQENESHVAGISHVVRFMILLFRVLSYPPRYAMKYVGCQSSIYDYATDKFRDQEREFALWPKINNKTYFNYGVTLLNRNIGQIRFYLGLPTEKMENTLQNLDNLLRQRFGILHEVQLHTGVSVFRKLRATTAPDATFGLNQTDFRAEPNRVLFHSLNQSSPAVESNCYEVGNGN